MYQDNKNGISVKLILDKRLKHKGDLFPIRVIVTFKRTPKYYNTGKKMTEEEWSKLFNSKSPAMVQIRNSVKDSFDLVLRCVNELASKGTFTFDQLNIRLGRASGGTLNSALKSKMGQLKDERRIGSMQFYEGVLSSVEKFSENEVAFEDVTPEWLKRYENFLLSKGNRYSTIGIRMRGIRAMMNIAKRQGLISEAQYPFGCNKFEIRTSESIKKALSIDQIAAISKFSDGNEMTDFFKDIWLFIYLCNGLNAADLVNLKYRNIVDDEICFVREKTKRTTKVIKEVRAIITPEMNEVLEKWGNPNKPDNYLFPLIRHTDDPEEHAKRVKEFVKQMNRRTKKIGKELGIGRVTTYTARHSFATVLKRSGANIAYISESLGHSDLKTTEYYLASFEKEERQKNASLLTQYKAI